MKCEEHKNQRENQSLCMTEISRDTYCMYKSENLSKSSLSQILMHVKLRFLMAQISNDRFLILAQISNYFFGVFSPIFQGWGWILISVSIGEISTALFSFNFFVIVWRLLVLFSSTRGHFNLRCHGPDVFFFSIEFISFKSFNNFHQTYRHMRSMPAIRGAEILDCVGDSFWKR